MDPPQEHHHRLDPRRRSEPQQHHRIERRRGLGCLATRAPEARQPVGTRAGCGLGNAEEGGEQRAPKLVGEPRVTFGQRLRNELALGESLTGNPIGVEALVAEARRRQGTKERTWGAPFAGLWRGPVYDPPRADGVTAPRALGRR